MEAPIELTYIETYRKPNYYPYRLLAHLPFRFGGTGGPSGFLWVPQSLPSEKLGWLQLSWVYSHRDKSSTSATGWHRLITVSNGRPHPSFRRYDWIPIRAGEPTI